MFVVGVALLEVALELDDAPVGVVQLDFALVAVEGSSRLIE